VVAARTPRAHQRIEWIAPIRLIVGDEIIVAETRNASAGGLLVATTAPIRFGTELDVVLQLPGQPTETTTRVVVRWTQPGMLGVQFVGLRAIELRALHQLLRRGSR